MASALEVDLVAAILLDGDRALPLLEGRTWSRSGELADVPSAGVRESRLALSLPVMTVGILESAPAVFEVGTDDFSWLISLVGLGMLDARGGCWF